MNIYTIYKATNKINNKHYIGFDSNFPSRIHSHKHSYPNTDFKFYRAIRKHGWDNFEWEIIYQSKELDHSKNVMENFFITEYDSYHNGYNATFGGEGTFGYIRSQEEKQFISNMISERNKGRSWFNNRIENKFCHSPPDETWNRGRINQKPTTKGKKYYNNGEIEIATNDPPDGWVLGRLPMSEETKTKLSKSKIGKPSPLKGKENPKGRKKIMTPDGEFESVKSAAKYYGKANSTMSNWLKDKPTEFYIL